MTDAASAGLIVDGVVAQSLAQRAAFWKLRDSLSEAQKPEGGSIKHDVSVPISAIPRFIAEASRAVIARGAGCQAGAVRPYRRRQYSLQHQPAGGRRQGRVPGAVGARSTASCTTSCTRIGGSISAEHGIGQAKIDEITRYKSAVALETMRAIKRALDPHGIMNPGKVVRV